MKKTTTLLITLIISIAGLSAQVLKAHTKTVEGSYNFWTYTPDGYDTCSTPKPLIVFLHGRSLCGNDLKRVRRYGPLNAIERGLMLDAVVLAPQNPGGAWKPSKVMKLVEWTTENLNIDTNRIYVIGMSLGGYGTIDFAGSYPHRIAAAMALCGGGTLKDFCGLNEMPLWILHGTAPWGSKPHNGWWMPYTLAATAADYCGPLSKA